MKVAELSQRGQWPMDVESLSLAVKEGVTVSVGPENRFLGNIWHCA